MKKKCLLLLALWVAVLQLAGCAGGKGHTTLTLMGRKSDIEKSYLSSIIRQYEEATGNQIKLIPYEDAEFEEKATRDFDAGKVPDLFLHFHNADLSRFKVSEHFYALNEEPWVSELTESARAYCTDQKGDLLGLPFWESSVSGCYYNKTLLDGLGLNAAATQAEFDVLCQALADIGYTPICWPASGCTWMFQFGMDPIFADDPALLEKLNTNEVRYADIPAMTDMVQWISDAAKKGWFGADYLKCGWGDISPALSNGDAVMAFIWDTWFYTDFVADGKYSKEDFALMPVFLNTVEEGTYEGGNLNMMMVNKDGDKLEEALEFLSFCAAEENINVAFDGIATVKCFQGQTTNIQSHMVTEAASSIEKKERVSTAATKIIGYSADDVSAAFDSLFRGKTDVAGCLEMMDASRIREAAEFGADGF